MSDIDWDLAPKGAVEIKINFSNKSINFFNGYGEYYSNGKWFKPIYIGDWELIATRPQDPREEYEKARAEKLEEWTHTCVGLKCKIIINKPDREGYIVIVNEFGEYYVVIEDDELKPIKPQISKSNAYEMLIGGYTAEHIKETYDVVDESSEVQS